MFLDEPVTFDHHFSTLIFAKYIAALLLARTPANYDGSCDLCH
jgi:hypothetical protein